MLVAIIHVECLLHWQCVVAAFAQNGCHIGAAVNRQVRILIGVRVDIALIEHTVVVVATSFCVVHHAGKVRRHDVAHALTAIRCFLYILTIEFPAAKEKNGRVFGRTAGIGVNRIEKVGAPGISHVGTLFECHIVGVIVACHADSGFVGSGVFEEEIASGQAHAEHLFRLRVTVKSGVFSAGVARVDP